MKCEDRIKYKLIELNEEINKLADKLTFHYKDEFFISELKGDIVEVDEEKNVIYIQTKFGNVFRGIKKEADNG